MELFQRIALNSSEINEIQKFQTYPFFRQEHFLMIVSERKKACSAVAISRYFEVETNIRVLENGFCSDRLKIDTLFGEQSVVVPREVFSMRKFEELNSKGLIYDNRAVSLLLQYIALSETHAPTMIQHISVGWVQQGEGISFLGLKSEGNANLQYTGEKDLSANGSLTNYINGLNELVVGRVGLEIALAAGLSSAVIGLLSTQGPVETLMLHFYGNSSNGKTTALQLAASVWGNPTMGKGILSSWNSTNNAFLEKLSNNFGVIACFDESSVLPRDFTSLIYSISQNTGKSRLSKTSSLQAERKFATSILSSGENSMLDSSNKNTGLRARLLEFFNSPLTDNSAHSNQLKRFVTEQYGTLGPAMVKLLTALDFNLLQKALEKWEDRLRQKISQTKPVSDRLIGKYAILLLTADLACENFKIRFNTAKMSSFLIRHHNALEADSDLGFSAYNCLLDWIVKNRGKLITHESLQLSSNVEGKFLEDNRVALLRSTFERILQENNFTDVKVATHELKQMGLIIPESKDRIVARVVINGIRVPCYRLKIQNDLAFKSAVSETPNEHDIDFD